MRLTQNKCIRQQITSILPHFGPFNFKNEQEPEISGKSPKSDAVLMVQLSFGAERHVQSPSTPNEK
jgi:hypothetical protein